MTPRPPRHVPLLVALSAAAVALVLGVAVGAVTLSAYDRLTASPAPDVPRYQLVGSWDLCTHVDRAPLAYFGSKETGAAADHSMLVGGTHKACTVEFDTPDTTQILYVAVAVFPSEDEAHRRFDHAGSGTGDLLFTLRDPDTIATSRVTGVGSEAVYRYEKDPEQPCRMRHGRLSVRHGNLDLMVDLRQCRVRGAPPDTKALRGAVLQLATDLMAAVRTS